MCVTIVHESNCSMIEIMQSTDLFGLNLCENVLKTVKSLSVVAVLVRAKNFLLQVIDPSHVSEQTNTCFLVANRIVLL